MNWRRYGSLFLLGFGVALVVAWFQPAPGYMDADYYLLGGLQLAEGKGFTEPILWNYLDDPDGLPHPSHGYWMPLTSILTAISLRLTPFDGFAGGRIIFLLLAGCVPPMTAWLAWGLIPDRGTRSRANMATLAGVLAAFPGFYLSFLTVPDAFGVYMLLGVGFLGIVNSNDTWKKWMGLGILAGLMHLTRADGFLWLGVTFFGVIFSWKEGYGKRYIQSLLRILYSVAGYLIVIGPWIARNMTVFGTPLAPGGVRALWVLNYDELFSFPVSVLTFERWWASGLGEILGARGAALGVNLQSGLGVQGQVFLLPLILVGLWTLRKSRAVQLGGLAWGLTFIVMTLVFPFSGARGGFFHSGAAVQPLFWAVVPVGLETFVAWGGRVRGWRVGQAQRVFGAGLVGLAILLTGAIFWMRVLLPREGVGYREVEKTLVAWGAKPGEVVMVNNPPGYYLAGGRPAVVVPNGDEETVLAVADRYGVRFVVFDENLPADLSLLFEHPELAVGLKFLDSVGSYQIFEVKR